MTQKSGLNSNRIAKNTFMLYIRMFLIMAISLFTSRILLEALGVNEYGVYNVVGGFVTMFAFMNNAMVASTQRYLTFELGKGNTVGLRNTFSTAVRIHYLIACVVFILGETVGIWFFNNKMDIPAESRVGGMWVLQCSIITTMVLIASMPYNAIIIAHEKMSAFAYISIFEVTAKLLCVYVLLCFSSKRLQLYALMMLSIQLVIRCIYIVYCRRHFPVARVERHFDKALFKEMFSFAGWNMWGSCASVLYNQGLNLLLNMFFGPAVNAARAIAVQVEGTILQFSQNFQLAVFPQITKTFAQGDLKNMHNLVIRGSKVTFLLLFVISFPLMIEIRPLLDLWLTVVPDYTVTFLYLIMSAIIIDSTARPIMQAASATGKVKIYQSVIGGILLSVVPIAYVVLKLGGSPSSVYVVLIAVISVAYVARLYIVRPLIKMHIREYFKRVILRCALVTFVAIPLPIALKLLLPENLLFDIVVFFASFFIVLMVSYFVGLDQEEKCFVKDKLKMLLSKLRHNK